MFKLADWKNFSRINGQKWLKHGIGWLNFDKDVFVIEYDQLKTRLHTILLESCNFLKLNTSDTILDCVVMNQEGAYHRKTSTGPELLVFSEEDKTLKNYEGYVKWYLERRCPNSPVCLQRSQVDFTSPPYARRIKNKNQQTNE